RNGATSGAPGACVPFRYQAAVAGSKAATPEAPEPAQSAATGCQPGAPYWNGGTSGAPGPAVCRRYQPPVAGRTTPTDDGPAGTARSSSASSASARRRSRDAAPPGRPLTRADNARRNRMKAMTADLADEEG